MQEARVKQFEQAQKRGLISNPHKGQEDIVFYLEDRCKKHAGTIVPVASQSMMPLEPGAKIDLVKVEESPEGLRATQWRLLARS